MGVFKKPKEHVLESGMWKNRTNYASINIRSFVTLSLHYPVFVLLLLCLYFILSCIILSSVLLLCLFITLFLFFCYFVFILFCLALSCLLFFYFVFALPCFVLLLLCLYLILTYIILSSVLLLLCLFIIMVNKKKIKTYWKVR